MRLPHLKRLEAEIAAGDVGLPRTFRVHLQPLDVDQRARAAMKGQRPVVVWFTGLSGAGKSTIANLVERTLAGEGLHTYLLDGDNVRSGLNRDLGFSHADRVENVRRIGEVAKLFVDAGLIVLVACISPFHAEREMARQLVGPSQFVEVFVDTPLDVCVARDPKGLYRRAKAGEIKDLTGMGSPYEPPLSPDLTLATTTADAASLAQVVVRHLMTGGYLSPLAHEPPA
jgi:bifunctional enzyme CysN/CysC